MLLLFETKIKGPGSWIDPDQLVIGGRGLSEAQEEAQMAIWSIWSAPLFMSNDLRIINENSLAILTNENLIKINQDKLAVLGMLANSTHNDRHQAFVKPILPVKGACPSFAIVYFNREDLGDWKEVSFLFN